MTDTDLDAWVALVRGAESGLTGDSAADWAERLDATQPKPAAALRTLVDAGRAEEAFELMPTLAVFWQHTGRAREGYRTLRPLADDARGVSDRRCAQALTSVSILAFRSGLDAEARITGDDALTLARRSGDPRTLIRALSQMARLGLRSGDLDLVRAVCTQALSLADQTGDDGDRRLPLHCLAEGTRLAGDLDAARPLYRESIALNDRLGNVDTVAMEQSNLAALETAAGHVGVAARLLVASLRHIDATRDMYLLPYVVLNAGGLLVASGRVDDGTRLLGTAQEMFDATGMAIDPADQPVFDAHVTRARTELGDEAFTAAFDEGRQTEAGAAIATALDALTAVDGDPSLGRISPRAVGQCHLE